MHLNNRQQAVINSTGRPLLVVAGAGAGKTAVIVHKIKHLIQSGYMPAKHILAIAFTNKAASELRERVKLQLDSTDLPVMGTFHSLCARILRESFTHLGRSNQFVIFDSQDQQAIIRQCLKTLSVNRILKPSQWVGIISQIKTDGYFPEAFRKQHTHRHYDASVIALYDAYQRALIQQSAVDFDDMLLYTVDLLRDYPDVRTHYQSLFRYIIVDEYQDVNACQYHITRLLTGGRPDICVVGDFDQTIYSWRGANVDHMLSFESDFDQVETVYLEQNYRSSSIILDGANSVIHYNKNRKEKKLWTDNQAGDPIRYYLAHDDRDEAQYCVTRLKAWSDTGMSLSSMAILLRTNVQSRVLEDVFLAEKIPYTLVGTVRFYERKEIKDLLAYLRLAYNPDDRYAFHRLIATPARGIGATSIAKLIAASDACNQPLLAVYDQVQLSQKQTHSLAQLATLMTDMRACPTASDALLLAFDASGYAAMLLNDPSEAAAERYQNCRELISLASHYTEGTGLDNTGNFLNHIALLSDIDTWQGQADAVSIMTMHHAKGLEFDGVIITGFEDSILPHYRAKDSEAALEEERRLCYVGMTRARHTLALTSARHRMVYGQLQYNRPSQFLFEITPQLLTIQASPALTQDPMALSHIFDPAVYHFLDDPDPLVLAAGDYIQHATWGRGQVISVYESAGSQCAVVRFNNKDRTIMPHYAPIQKL